MAAAASLSGADRIFLMGYDYHFAGSQPGASSPMDRLDGEDRDLVWSLDRYASLGVPAERTLLGLPLYGMVWPVSGPGIGAPSLGRGATWVPRRNLRVFEDDDGRMNRSLADVGGEVLLVPQFTLYGSVRKGRRPSWDAAAPPEIAADIVDSGIVVTGGGALLRGIDERLRAETGVPVAVADEPLTSVVRGVGHMLGDINLLKRVANAA